MIYIHPACFKQRDKQECQEGFYEGSRMMWESEEQSEGQGGNWRSFVWICPIPTESTILFLLVGTSAEMHFPEFQLENENDSAVSFISTDWAKLFFNKFNIFNRVREFRALSLILKKVFNIILTSSKFSN